MSLNTPITELDYAQVLQREFQVDSDAIRTYPSVGYDSATDSSKVTVIGGTLINVPFDAITVTYPTTSQEVYTYHTGGTGGTVVGVITVNYTDSTKANLLNVIKT